MPGGTVYVAVADESTTVSLISSNYAFFGSGVVVEEGGFVLQNRGAGFRGVTPAPHPNNPAPGRRPFHTIVPALVRRGGTGRWGALGVTGGQFQPQGPRGLSECGFGSGVIPEQGQRYGLHRRRDVDDRAAARGVHRRQYGCGERER